MARSCGIISLVGEGAFDLHLSVPVVLEYEDAAMRLVGEGSALTRADVESILDYLCAVGTPHEIHFLWRPVLRDPRDDMFLELAVEAGCESIVTHNVRDFAGADRFGIRIRRPRDFLHLMRGGP